MKHAFVLVHHVGLTGEKVEREIFECTNTRFDELEEKGLVREATPEEIEAGYQPAFERDDSADRFTDGETLNPAFERRLKDAEDAAQGYISRLVQQHTADLRAATDRIVALTGDLDTVRNDRKQAEEAVQEQTRRADRAEQEVTALKQQLADQAAAKNAADEKAAPASGKKQAETPDNKKAPEPNNKGN